MDKTKTLVILALSVQFLNGILFPQPTVCKGKGNICGDKCAAKCTCGETFFDSGDALYCCIPKNETCRRKGQGQDSKATCANGKAIPFEVFCEDQGQCPIHTGLTATALKSDCSHISNHACPVYPLSSKICMDKVNVSLSRYCSPEYGNHFKCQSAGGGLTFEQCYNGGLVMHKDQMTCISRRDKNKNIFSKKIDSHRRWNTYSLIDIRNGSLACANETYPLSEICYITGFAQSIPCTLHGTNEKVDLEIITGGTNFELCVDFSFWRPDSERCIPKNLNETEAEPPRFYTFPPLCERNRINCFQGFFNENCPNATDLQLGCNQENSLFFCNRSQTCIPRGKICDGIFHCMYGEDEMFELCKNHFPEQATIRCIENRLPGINLTIMAIPCDGVVECRDGSDEIYCEDDKMVLVVATSMIFLFTICIYLYLICIRLPLWKERHILEFQDNGVKSEMEPLGCNEMKGNVLAKFKNETSQSQCAEALKVDGTLGKMKNYIFKKLFTPRIQQFMDPILLMLTQMDFMKDMTLVVRMITLLGGSVVFMNPHLFSSTVVFCLLGTIFIPQYLGTLSYVVSNSLNHDDLKQILSNILLVTFSPLFSYILHFKNLCLNLKLRLYPKDQNYIKAIEDMKKILLRHVKLELGLETVYQMAITLILLLLSYTETPVEEGLKTLFNEDLGSVAFLLLIASNITSGISFSTSYCNSTNICREHFPITSRLVASFYSFFGLIARVTSIVMYFAVSLGLFSLLRHWQAEQTPWGFETLDFVTPDGLMFLGNNEPFIWSNVDRWIKNGTLFITYDNTGTSISEPVPNPNHLVAPPDYTLYVGLTLHTYFYIFFVHVGIHMIFIFIAKYKLSHEFNYGFNMLDKIIHCLENTNLPSNVREWDDGKGDAEEHRRRMYLNWREGLVVIIINAVFNLSLLIPLYYLAFRMQERHDVLSRTIGYLNEEQEALDTGYLLCICSTVTVFGGCLLQIISFYLYNGACHPFANILIV